ncbi:LysR family transcriptional regulator [Nonomuraea sp. WAC 01424]|uniref:LysR family transcriptional regulator n=1 Tax=Nonomuraea sp. WAC 01424 TaxID=2203200 RepID=UPI000F77ABA0|nr:LysR family transcriptional regulator [Nonomuraea sp. WAC 01424]RSM96608.1 LysR family transcriptional regulator [Nonomuraea sp. WAC 01424]
MSPLSLDLLRTFLAVHRTGSITAAAQTLGLSQPAVTAQVKTLEATLDRPLFDRLPRGVAPTPAAAELARRIAPALDALDEVAGSELPSDEAVHLGGPAEFLCEVVMPMLAPLVRDGLRLRTTLGLADDLLADLAAGRLDLVLSTIRPRVRGVRADPVYDEEFVLVAAPSLAATLPPGRVGPKELATVPMVAYAEDLPIVRRYWRTVFGRRPSMAAQVVIPDLRGVLSAVRAGTGVSVLPAYLCRRDLAEGTLVVLAEPAEPPINTGYLAVRSGALARTAVARVRAHLLEAFRAAPPY